MKNKRNANKARAHTKNEIFKNQFLASFPDNKEKKEDDNDDDDKNRCELAVETSCSLYLVLFPALSLCDVLVCFSLYTPYEAKFDRFM